jgi:hypothetical protein|tara:strand:+ start:206 stop:529 length:324 start_codon:yes stop_codon:yes gene_type:complete
MTNSYWNGTGNYQGIIDKLSEEIPIEGACENKALDHLRQAINAYYDIFNNAGCNSVSRKVSKYFPGVMRHLRGRANYRSPNWELIESIVEPIMDQHVLKTANKIKLN